MLKTLANTPVNWSLDCQQRLNGIPEEMAVAAFRIAQEAVTNMLRHAQAHTVELNLALDAGWLCLTISDDGCGFVAPTGRPSSFGLVGMRERVLMLGGELHLDSRLGEGTTLSVRIPLE